MALKGNQDKASKEVISLFATTHPDHIEEYVADCELNHDRIEERTVSLIGGHLLSVPIRRKWKGAENGCVVRVEPCAHSKQRARKQLTIGTTSACYWLKSMQPSALVR